jgi:DNA primase
VESIAEGSGARTREVTRPERHGVSQRTVIEEAKAKVPTIDLADRLCGPGQLRKVGKEWAALCPLPDHQERTPSFTVNPDKNVWWCFGCVRGGDVVELARFARGYERHEAATAAANLLHDFGYEIPPRPASWHRKNERQKPIRDAIQEARVRHTQRRLFRIFMPMIEELEDENERREEADYLWGAAEEIAVLVVAGRAS